MCDFIASRQPHAVFLQEVIPSTWSTIVGKLDPTYDCFSATTPPVHYYPAILVKRSDVQVRGSLECLGFPTTSMGRHLLQLPIEFSGVSTHLMTSHLESMKDHGSERKKQLKTVFSIMSDLHKSKACIFGGDLNLRDSEVKSVGLPQNTVDVWEACGSEEAHKYTWDVGANDNLNWQFPNKPKLRFDRVYLSPSHGKLQPKSFSLVGKERLPSCGRFPSDHWGIWMEFELM